MYHRRSLADVVELRGHLCLGHPDDPWLLHLLLGTSYQEPDWLGLHPHLRYITLRLGESAKGKVEKVAACRHRDEPGATTAAVVSIYFDYHF